MTVHQPAATPHLIAAALAMPKTHRVVTSYACGNLRTHETRSLSSAENHAVGERRKIGRRLLDRDTGKTVIVVAVEVEPIPATNGDWLRAQSGRVGIPLQTVADVRETLERCKKTKADAAMARAMLKHGRLTAEAREYVAQAYPAAAGREVVL